MSVAQAKWQHSGCLGWCRINPFHMPSSGSYHSLSVLWDRVLREGTW